MSSQYPRDEFDLAGEDMPVGMHRPQPSRWKAVLPFLAILVIVPLLAWGASSFLTHRVGSETVNPPSAQSSAQSAPSEPMSDGEPEPVEAPAEEPRSEAAPVEQPQSTPTEGIVDRNVKISVLNGTGVNGLAAERVSELANAGFPGASAANAEGWVSEVSVVYYEDPNLEASAKAIGKALGIDNVRSTTGLGDPDVVVLLR